ncbi:hypothetical protein ALC57_02000, partial [Trachymyrmex cornetzi]
NTTNTFIPDNVKSILQLRHKFNLPDNKYNNEKTAIEFIKNTENNIAKLEEPVKNVIRNDTISILKNLHTNNKLDDINNLKGKSRVFLRDMNDRVIFTRPDKGNVMVALDRQMYISKVNEMLQDVNTYEVVVRDATRRMVTGLRALLVRWKEKKYISDSTYRGLLCNGGILPIACDLPKIHKQIYKIVLDGFFYQNNDLFRRNINSIAITLYYDDLEIVNPLGAKLKNKLAIFYWTLANIYPELRSTLKNVNLLSIVKHIKKIPGEIKEIFVHDNRKFLLFSVLKTDTYDYHGNSIFLNSIFAHLIYMIANAQYIAE